MKIGILGLPSTGKTTLARALSSKLHEYFNSIELITEYARDYIAQNGQLVDLWEQYLITTKQISKEVNTSAQVLVTDSPVIQGLLYCGDLYAPHKGCKQPELMSEIFSTIIKYVAQNPYDYIVVLNKAAKVFDDGVRSEEQLSEEWRSTYTTILNYVISITKPGYVIYLDEVDLNERVDNVIKQIQLKMQIDSEIKH